MEEQARKKKEKPMNYDIEVVERFAFTNDKRGMHQQAYHNQAKLYHKEHPELSYRECLRVVYKNNKNDEKII